MRTTISDITSVLIQPALVPISAIKCPHGTVMRVHYACIVDIDSGTRTPLTEKVNSSKSDKQLIQINSTYLNSLLSYPVGRSHVFAMVYSFVDPSMGQIRGAPTFDCFLFNSGKKGEGVAIPEGSTLEILHASVHNVLPNKVKCTEVTTILIPYLNASQTVFQLPKDKDVYKVIFDSAPGLKLSISNHSPTSCILLYSLQKREYFGPTGHLPMEPIREIGNENLCVVSYQSPSKKVPEAELDTDVTSRKRKASFTLSVDAGDEPRPVMPTICCGISTITFFQDMGLLIIEGNTDPVVTYLNQIGAAHWAGHWRIRDTPCNIRKLHQLAARQVLLRVPPKIHQCDTYLRVVTVQERLRFNLRRFGFEADAMKPEQLVLKMGNCSSGKVSEDFMATMVKQVEGIIQDQMWTDTFLVQQHCRTK